MSTLEPFARRVDGVHVVDLFCDPSAHLLPWQRRALLWVLILAVKERSTQLLFDPWLFEAIDSRGQRLGMRMGYYNADGQLQEMVPPLREYMGEFHRDLKTLADLRTPRRRLAHLLRRLAYVFDKQIPPVRQGQLRLSCGDQFLDVGVTLCPSTLGDRVFLSLPPISEAISERIHSVHRTHFASAPDVSPQD